MTDAKDRRIAALEHEVDVLRASAAPKSVRRRSETVLWGMPLWEIAVGPDVEADEVRGHARGVFALGDVATGVVALGGIARGVFACGGVAVGAIGLGGCSLGLLFAGGGLAVGGVAVGGLAVGGLALGGAAVGYVAVGGGAIGCYAAGGGAVGQHVVGPMRQDPEAVRFFREWLPGFARVFPR